VLFTVSQSSPFFAFYLFNAIFIKMGVPLFFMASGALLLGKEESIKKVIKSRFLRYLTVLIIASFMVSAKSEGGL
jgi:surface polysaccharide O-acyltransferase-like enzyme